MSADNGYILRKNVEGKYVLQMYFDSADEYPPIDDEGAEIFDSLEGALCAFEDGDDDKYWSEYGLTVRVKEVTMPKTKGEVIISS